MAGTFKREIFSDLALTTKTSETTTPELSLEVNYGDSQPRRDSGKFRIFFNEPHTISGGADDGIRIWIDDVKVYDAWLTGTALAGFSFTFTPNRTGIFDVVVEWNNFAGQYGGYYVKYQSANQVLATIQAAQSVTHDFGKHLTDGYKGHLQNGTSSRALLWKITRRDGRVFAYTPHDEDIKGDDIRMDGLAVPECVGVTFKAKNGVAPTGLANSMGLSADNMEVKAFFDDEEIAEEEIEAGFFDDAEVWIAECNWQDLTQGVMRHKVGFIGEFRYGQGVFEAETKALSSRLEQNIIELTSLDCRCEQLGDVRCGFNLSGTTLDGLAATVTGSISTVSTTQPRRAFTISGASPIVSYPTNRFAHGRFRVTTSTSKNKNLWCKIRTNNGANLELADLLPYQLEVGDAFEMIIGCDRTIGTCASIFGNAISFQGEPYSPGVELYQHDQHDH